MNSLTTLSRPKIMGVVNVTPDSFSDGGEFFQAKQAIQHALDLVADGVDIIDIGGESTRPDADDVSVSEELSRIVPVIQGIKAQSDVYLSIDTQKTEVMQEVLSMGIQMINDVNALQAPGALEVVASSNVDVCLMHRQGLAKTMQLKPCYKDVVDEVYAFLSERIEACVKQGLDTSRITIDPGFGFGKEDRHNLQLIKSLTRFQQLGVPVLIGVSRKSTLGRLLGRPEKERLAGSLSLAVMAYLNGASLFRVHDVKETVDALSIATQVMAIT